MYYENFHFEVIDIRAMEEKVFQPPNNIALYCNVLGGFYSRWNFIALQKSKHYS
jgi:hypothetical protein